MSSKTNLITKAKSYLGYDYKHFTATFGGGCFPWCAAFVSTVALETQNGDIIFKSTSCNAQIDYFKMHGMWLGVTTDIRVGDILYYDWDMIDEPLPADHVGIVVDVSGNTVTVIEGNKGDKPSDQTKVEYRQIPRNYAFIFGVARPKYDDDEVQEKADTLIDIKQIRQLEEGCKGKDVEAMQSILIGKGCSCGSCGSDGDFGEKTKMAVEEYQKRHKLDVDGICGEKTWYSLIME